MKTIYKSSFARDVKKSELSVQISLKTVIQNIDDARSLTDIANLKKLKGHSSAYRIKVNNHRLCFYFEEQTVILSHFLPRKDIYRFFP